jgi:hypothetical protein
MATEMPRCPWFLLARVVKPKLDAGRGKLKCRGVEDVSSSHPETGLLCLLQRKRNEMGDLLSAEVNVRLRRAAWTAT